MPFRRAPAALGPADRFGEPSVEPRKIHANDGVRFTVDGELEQFVKKSSEFRVVLQNLDQPHYCVLRHVERKVHARAGQVRSARAKKMQSAEFGARIAPEFRPQCLHKFGREQVAARLTRNQHDLFGTHHKTPLRREASMENQGWKSLRRAVLLSVKILSFCKLSP